MPRNLSIEKFYSQLGFTLHNTRWSWGARKDNVFLLKNWQDRYLPKERLVQVLDGPDVLRTLLSFGMDERIKHLEAIWAGGQAAYTVLATVLDPAAQTRKTKDFRDDVVFAIDSLVVQPNGSVWARLLPVPVPVNALEVHAATHRTQAGGGDFPVSSEFRKGEAFADYKTRAAALRPYLIEVAREQRKVTYSDVMERFNLDRYSLRSAMNQTGKLCQLQGEPVLTSLIVGKASQRSSEGLAQEFDVADDQAERERCYAFWAREPASATAATPANAEPEASPVPESGPASVPPTKGPPSPPSPKPAPAPSEFEQLAARFARVEQRPHQAAFRNAVFKACGGKCVLSGCDVPEALEAAHLKGRNWRAGHNQAHDGVLLRRDLHALYDQGLLVLGDDGAVQLAERLGPHYAFLRTSSGARQALEGPAARREQPAQPALGGAMGVTGPAVSRGEGGTAARRPRGPSRLAPYWLSDCISNSRSPGSSAKCRFQREKNRRYTSMSSRLKRRPGPGRKK